MARPDDQLALFPELPAEVIRRRRRARLFFALWPEARIRAELARAAALIPPGDAPNAWRVRPERYHLTLAFLGELPAPGIEAALEAGDAVSAAGFSLKLDRVGHFVGANVVWIGPSECPPSLTALKAALDRELLHRQLPVGTAPFVPHLTSVRGVRDAPDAPAPDIDWPVREFALIRNSSASGRSRYTVLRRWPLCREPALKDRDPLKVARTPD